MSIATLAWTVYTDLQKQTPRPSPAVIARTIRVRLSDNGELDPAQRDRVIVIDIVVDDTVQAGEHPN